MTKLNTAAPSRGKTYEPGPFLGALPLPYIDASAERWRMATRTLVNPTPSAYAQHAPRPTLPERLFEALAVFKLRTATLAVAHFNRDERARLFKQLDSLLDAESWDSAELDEEVKIWIKDTLSYYERLSDSTYERLSDSTLRPIGKDKDGNIVLPQVDPGQSFEFFAFSSLPYYLSLERDNYVRASSKSGGIPVFLYTSKPSLSSLLHS